MQRTGLMLIVLAAWVAAIQCGCRDNTPPPPRVPVPSADNSDRTYQQLPPRPLAQQVPDPNAGRMYADVPLVNERPPEQREFVDAYNRVGRPRIVLFVNRTLDGQIVPVSPPQPLVSVEHHQQATTGLTVQSSNGSSTYGPYWGQVSQQQRSQSFSTQGPGEYSEQTTVYLQPDQYDQAGAAAMDYQAMETILTDWLAANGQVVIISPTMARQRLTDQQVQDLQSGRPQVLSELARQLDAEVLVQVQAHPTSQTPQGLTIRIICEAINTRDGQSIGRAVVDMPPPLEKTRINEYTRFLARKLMDEMTQTWSHYGPPPAAAAPQPGTTPPQGAIPPQGTMPPQGTVPPQSAMPPQGAMPLPEATPPPAAAAPAASGAPTTMP